MSKHREPSVGAGWSTSTEKFRYKHKIIFLCFFMGQPKYLELLAEAERLKEQAEAIRLEEVATIAKQITATLNLYQISLDDLMAAGYKFSGAKRVAPAPEAREPKGKRPPVPMKYQDPNNPANRWSGRGILPTWVRLHIDAGGKKEDLLIK